LRDQARISRWRDLPDANAVLPAIDDIFYAASNTQSFASEAARAAFRERWLGRYLSHDSDHFYVALEVGGSVIGYLAGSFDDPARTPRFSDIAYFADLANETRRYPAHLHVNLAASARGSGIGSELVRSFAASAKAAGLPGVHVVTGAGARNVGFYSRLMFMEQRRFPYHGHNLVFLGRDL